NVFTVARNPEGVVKADQCALDTVAVLAAPVRWIDRTEAPAIDVAPPFAVVAADLAIQADIRRNYAAVFGHALEPGVHVVQDPGAVFLFLGQHVGVKRQGSGHKVEKMIADDVGVFLIMSEKLLVIALAVQQRKSLGIEGVAGPIE